MVKRISQQNKFFGFSTVGRLPQDSKLFDLDLIKQDLLNRLHTRKGERVMYPRLGSIIWDMLFEPLTEINRDLIIRDVSENVRADSRLEVQAIQVEDIEHGIRISCELLYRPYNIAGPFVAEFDRRSLERS